MNAISVSRVRRTRLWSAFVVVAALTSVACSKKDEPVATAEAPKAAAALTPAPAMAAIDRNRPLESYRKVDKATQVAAYYHALGAAPVNMEKFVESISSEYRDTADGFKKKEIVARMTPALEADLAQARQERYFKIELNSQTHAFGMLDGYDFQKNAFPVTIFRTAKTEKEVAELRTEIGAGLFVRPGVQLNLNRFDGGNAPTVSLRGWEAYRVLPVSDQEKAKAIEALITARARLKLRLYLYAAEAAEDRWSGGRADVLRADLVKVQVLDPKDNILIEL